MATFQPDMLATYRGALDNTIQAAQHGQNMRLQDFYRRKGPELFPGDPTLGELAQVAPEQAFALQANRATAADAAQKAQLESARRLINGVMSLPEPDRPVAYKMAREIATRSGMDVSGFGEEYDPAQMAMAQAMFNKTEDERTEFERILGNLKEGSPEYNAAIRQYLKLDPPPKAAEKPPAPTKYRYIDPNDPSKGVELTPGWRDSSGIRVTTNPDGTTTMIVGGEGEDPRDRATIGIDAKYVEEITNEAKNANRLGVDIDSLEANMKHPDFYSGAGAETLVLPLKRLGVAAGVLDEDSAVAMENFGSISNSIILKLLGGSLGNQISNADREFIKATSTSLSNTPEGNVKLIEYMRRLQKRAVDVERKMHEFQERNNGRVDWRFRKELQEWIDSTSIFDTTARTEPVLPTSEIKPVPKTDPQYIKLVGDRAYQIMLEVLKETAGKQLTEKELAEIARDRMRAEGWDIQ